MLVLMLISPFTFADESGSEPDLSLEFLEFLGEWETDEGEWIDPDQLESEAFADLTDEVSYEHEQDE